MEARPNGSGRERSSPNRCDQCRGQARHPVVVGLSDSTVCAESTAYESSVRTFRTSLRQPTMTAVHTAGRAPVVLRRVSSVTWQWRFEILLEFRSLYTSQSAHRGSIGTSELQTANTKLHTSSGQVDDYFHEQGKALHSKRWSTLSWRWQDTSRLNQRRDPWQ